MENDIINEYKENLSNHYSIKRNTKMETLPLMHWIPKMNKTPVGARLIIASSKCALKPLSKDIRAIFELFYKKIEDYHSKVRIWSGGKKILGYLK